MSGRWQSRSKAVPDRLQDGDTADDNGDGDTTTAERTADSSTDRQRNE